MSVGNGKKNIDFILFGININEISTNIKYFISFVFIILLFGSIIYGLKKIKSFDRQVKSKVKKDKKN
jgi:flagellar biogenesis protein FliO